MSENNFSNMIDTLIVNNVVYNDVFVLTASMSQPAFESYDCKIWRMYFSKVNGLVKYDEINNVTWNRMN